MLEPRLQMRVVVLVGHQLQLRQVGHGHRQHLADALQARLPCLGWRAAHAREQVAPIGVCAQRLLHWPLLLANQLRHQVQVADAGKKTARSRNGWFCVTCCNQVCVNS